MKIKIHNLINRTPLSQKKLKDITGWLCTQLKLPIQTLDIIITDDESLKDMHEQYLNDSGYTDIMTFNLGTNEAIEGEIYISKDRAIENASRYDVSFANEICRLITHGCLHLAGYEDLEKQQRLKMKKKEEYFLSQIIKKFIN